MTNTAGPVYEVTVKIDRDIVEEFDAWLERHIEGTLAVPGIERIEVFEPDDDGQGRARRIAQYHFAGNSELDAYLSGQGDSALEPASERFGERIDTTARVLRHAGVAAGQQPVEACLNCGTPLTGQYCGNCGQRAASRLISIWELLKDAFGDLLEFDSRLWRTLIPLLMRPGQLTRDYLRGRRARYMPPFRMYLVLSIVFFLLAFFDPREELGVLFEAPPPPTAERVGGAGGDEPDAEGPNVVVSIDGEPNEECDLSDYHSADLPGWLASRLTKERLQRMCNRIVADGGRAFWRELSDNVPAALFVLLPLMALVLKLLYPLSKRYYVEHLLFVVHYHAFVFLILSLQVLAARLGSFLHVPELPIDVLEFAMALYVPVYLYKAQRRVYEQGRLLSAMKFVLLTFAYFGGLFVMFATVAIFAAFSFSGSSA